MPIEIERKFLVKDDSWLVSVFGCERIVQGYMSTDINCTVRIRLTSNEKGYITVKGKTVGISRQEYEYEIPHDDAADMLKLMPSENIIEKVRHKVLYGNLTWEIDRFLGSNAGLVIAEVELPSETAEFNIPPWVGDEVSTDPRYTNGHLSVCPFCMWPQDEKLKTLEPEILNRVYNRVIDVLTDERFLYNKASKLTMSSDIRQVLDSLDVTELAMELEDTFDIEIDQDVVNTFVTVSDVVCKVSTLLIEKGNSHVTIG